LFPLKLDSVVVCATPGATFDRVVVIGCLGPVLRREETSVGILGIVRARDAEAVNASLIVLDVPDDSTSVSNCSTMAAESFDHCVPNGSWRALKVIFVVGDALGAAVVNLNRIRIRVERSHVMWPERLCRSCHGNQCSAEPQRFKARVLTKGFRELVELVPPSEAAWDVRVVWFVKEIGPHEGGHEKEVGCDDQ